MVSTCSDTGSLVCMDKKPTDPSSLRKPSSACWSDPILLSCATMGWTRWPIALISSTSEIMSR